MIHPSFWLLSYHIFMKLPAFYLFEYSLGAFVDTMITG
jgi:hypothetical protein